MYQQTAFYTSESMKIGKHEWRVRVVPKIGSSERKTAYQWRKIGDEDWNRHQDWPEYNFHVWNCGLPNLNTLNLENQTALEISLQGPY